jgi:uncharacterized SAM-binding protein YcdF (DUF218 family)
VSAARGARDGKSFVTTALIWLLVKPSDWILYTAVLGVVLWRLSIGRWLRVAAVILVVVLGVLPTAWLLSSPLERRFPVPTNLDRVDGVIVLAGAERAELSKYYRQPLLNQAADRLTTFLLLARRFPDARLVHSGDTAPESESAVARELLLGAGIDPQRIVFETRSRTTCESPRATLDLVPVDASQRWLLVTSATHMRRAIACFRAAGWDVAPYPTNFRRGPNTLAFSLPDNLGDVDLAAHEWVGLLYYRLRGYTRELFPGPR